MYVHVHDTLTPTYMHVCVAVQRMRCGKPDLSFYHVSSGKLRLSGWTANALTPRAVPLALKFYLGDSIRIFKRTYNSSFFVLLIRLAEGFPVKTFRYQNMHWFINAAVEDQGF